MNRAIIQSFTCNYNRGKKVTLRNLSCQLVTSVKPWGPRPGGASHFSKVPLACHRAGLFVFFWICGRRQPPRGNAEALWQEWQRAPPKVTHLLNCLHYSSLAGSIMLSARPWSRLLPRKGLEVAASHSFPSYSYLQRSNTTTIRALIQPWDVLRTRKWFLKANALVSTELLSQQSQ